MISHLTWFPFSILATTLFGISTAFYKLPTAKNASRSAALFWTMATSLLLSVVFFYSYLHLTVSGMIWYSMAWGVSFSLLTFLQMWALQHVETNVLFPVTTTSSLVLSVLAGLLFFHDKLSILQSLGILLVVCVVFMFLYKGGHLGYSRIVLNVGVAIIVLSALNKIIQKVSADHFDIHAYQIWQFVFAALFSLALVLWQHRRDWPAQLFSKSIGIGGLISVASFFGGYSLFTALTRGPFSLITSVHSLYIIVTALVGWLLFKEELTKKKIGLILLAIIAILLIRFG